MAALLVNQGLYILYGCKQMGRVYVTATFIGMDPNAKNAIMLALTVQELEITYVLVVIKDTFLIQIWPAKVAIKAARHALGRSIIHAQAAICFY